MPVPSAITDLSTTLASNSPAGSDNVFPDLDNYLRAHAQFVALLRDGRGLSTEVSLASAATCDIGGAASMFVQITGTTTITSFGTNYLPRILRFAGVLTLTHNATTLILPTGANITTAAGDMCLAVPVGTSGWRVLQYQRASEGADFVSFLPAGTGASSRTVQSKLRDVVSVKDFGAACDGATNDSTAVQAAINYCLTFDPPAVLVVPGLCRIDSTVNIDRATDAVNASTFFTIRGDGTGAGFYAYIGMTMFSTTLSGYSASQKIHFDNIVFKSEFPSNPTYVLDDAKFLRVKFTNCAFHRIKCLNATRYLQTYYFDDCMAYGWLGTFFNGTNGAYDIKFDNFIAEAGGSFTSLVCNDVYSGDPVAQFTVSNSLIQAMSSFAIQADRCQGVSINNVYFENNGADGSPDLKFDTARNLSNLAPNGSINVTGCFFSQLLANFNNASYYSIRWGRVTNGFATGNYLVDLGTGATPQLHYTQAESRVVFLGEPDYIQGHFSQFVYAAGGYVMPGTGGERLRILRGEISAVGAIVRGTGFTLTKTGTGQYQIDAQTAFSAPPTIVASPIDSHGQNVSALVGTANSSTMSVSIRTVAHAFIDCAFQFTVIGPA